MNYQFANSNGPEDFQKIDKFAREIGVKFPDEYQEFLTQTNGGKEDFIFDCDGRHLEISVFFGLLDHEKQDGFKWNLNTFSHRFDVKTFFPVAQTAGGDLICLNITDKKVYVWWHEDEELEPLTEGFLAFWELLQLDEPIVEDIDQSYASERELCENAAMEGDEQTVKAILDNKGEIGEAMRLAAMNGNIEIVDLLISHGHDINQVCSDGRTPTDWTSWDSSKLELMRARGGKLITEL